VIGFLFAMIKVLTTGGDMSGLLVTLLIIVGIVILSGIKIINQYERGVVLTLGRYTGIRTPGLRIVIPIFQRLIKVDVRSTPIDVPKQEIITKDNVTVGVDAVVYLRVIEASKAVLETTNYVYATSQFAQAALRDVTGNADLDELLSKREEISQKIKEIVDSETDKWGIDVENVKIQNIELPQDMKRAMAKQAEAERERRAVIITAEGEKAAAQSVADAAAMLSKVPGGINIRTLQTLEKIAVEPSQKTLVVLPSELTNLKDILR
jgi:regulator of protease activity HflC (stomatin/prohibitin superfamily)